MGLPATIGNIAGAFFTASFTATLSTTDPRDIVSILPSSLTRAQVYEICLGIATTGTGVAQNLGVTLLRGSTAAAAGSALAAVHHGGWSGAPTAKTSASGNSTALQSTASAVQLHADVMSDGRYKYQPAPGYAPVLEISQRLTVRATAPAAQPITVLGSITWAEIGRSPTGT